MILPIMAEREFLITTKFGFFPLPGRNYQSFYLFNCLRTAIPCEIYKADSVGLPSYMQEIDPKHEYYQKFLLIIKLYDLYVDLKNFYRDSNQNYDFDLLEICQRIRKLDYPSSETLANLHFITAERLIQ